MAKYKRVRRRGDQIDQASVDSNSYSEASGARKVIPAGWSPFKIIGAINTAVAVQTGINIAVYNNSSSVGFVAFYKTGAAVVPSATTGVAVPPNSYLYLNSSTNNFIISSASTLLAYQMEDETAFGPTNPNQ